MAVFGGRRITRTGGLFVIGIIVLGALVVGGIFLVKNHGEAVRRDQAVKIAEANLKDQSKQPTSAQPATNATDNPETSNPPAAGANPPSSTDTGTTGNSSNSNTPNNSNTSTLPVTGPDDLQAFGRTIIVAIVALSVAFYVSSRRTVRTD